MSKSKRQAQSSVSPPPAESPNLLRKCREAVVPALQQRYHYGNPMEVPRIAKVVVNVGVGEAKDNAKALESAVRDIRVVTGQQPVVVRARKSVSAFKLRAGMPVGVKATLRGPRMWYFLEKLIQVALPRIRDFRGVPDNFDGRGNYNLGLREQITFPEIQYDAIDKIRGLEVCIVTTAGSDDEALTLLAGMGMPFRH